MHGHMSDRRVASVMVVVMLAGCSSSSSDGEVEAFEQETAASGLCIGTAIQAHEMNDSESCIRQGGRWDFDFGLDQFLCTGVGRSCDDRNEDSETCTYVFGCRWQSDGTVTSNPRDGGRCEGTVPPCLSLSTEECRLARNCTPDEDGCDQRVSTAYLNTTDCEGIQQAIVEETVHPEVAYDACLQRFGCRWIHPDGTVEPGLDGPSAEEPGGQDEPIGCTVPIGRYSFVREPDGQQACATGDGEFQLTVADDVEAILWPEGCPEDCTCEVGSGDAFETFPAYDGFDPANLTCKATGQLQCQIDGSSFSADYLLQGEGDTFWYFESTTGFDPESDCFVTLTRQ